MILGVPVDAISLDAALELIVARGTDPLSPAAYVVKPYVEFFGPQATDEVRDILAGAWLSLPDGVALQWAAAYSRPGRHGPRELLASLSAIVLKPDAVAEVIPERFAGITFTLPLLRRCAERGLSVFLVGSPKRSSIEATARHLTELHPRLRIAGVSPGDVGGTARDRLLGELRRIRPDVVLVGVGFPRQERLMAWLAPQLEHGVLIGEGGSFDFREFGGAIRRAPDTIRRLGLEWLWRLGREPRRVRRQLTIPRFILDVHVEARRRESPHRNHG